MPTVSLRRPRTSPDAGVTQRHADVDGPLRPPWARGQGPARPPPVCVRVLIHLGAVLAVYCIVRRISEIYIIRDIAF